MQKLTNIERLFRAHYPSMYRVAIALLRNADEAHDVVSDVFADLLDGRLGYGLPCMMPMLTAHPVFSCSVCATAVSICLVIVR